MVLSLDTGLFADGPPSVFFCRGFVAGCVGSFRPHPFFSQPPISNRMAALAGFDLGMVGSLPPAAFASITMDGNEYVRCSKCGYGGCDVRISGCGCTLHTVSVFQY